MKNIMKKWILLLSIIFIFNSCSNEGDNNGVVYVLPIKQVEMPSSYAINTVSKIKIKYKRPTDCYIFSDFLISSTSQKSKTISIQTVKLDNLSCVPDEGMVEVLLDFKPTEPGTYTFNFWLGTDVNGTNQYATHEVQIL